MKNLDEKLTEKELKKVFSNKIYFVYVDFEGFSWKFFKPHIFTVNFYDDWKNYSIKDLRNVFDYYGSWKHIFINFMFLEFRFDFKINHEEFLRISELEKFEEK